MHLTVHIAAVNRKTDRLGVRIDSEILEQPSPMAGNS
jgi:hypothetical protein